MLIHGGPCNCYLIKVLGAPWVQKASESLIRELLSRILQEEKKSHVDREAIAHLPHTQNQNRISSVCLRTVLYTHIKSSAKGEPGIRDSSSETIPKWTPVSWRLCWLLRLLPSVQCGVKLLLQDFSEGRQGKTSRLSLPHSTGRTDKSPSKPDKRKNLRQAAKWFKVQTVPILPPL